MSTLSPQPNQIDRLLDQLNTACFEYTQAICKAYQAGTYTLAIKDATLAISTLNEAIEKAPNIEKLIDQSQDLINNNLIKPTDTRFLVLNDLLTKLNSIEQEFIDLVSQIQDQQDHLLDVVQIYYTSGSHEQYEELVQNKTRQFLYSMEEGLLLPLISNPG